MKNANRDSRRLSRRRNKHVLTPRIERFEDRLLLAVFNVTSVADDASLNTLRAAITGANASSDASNTIDFQIGAAASSHTITLTSDLPAITKQVLIDGYSQGGTVNTLSIGTNALIPIQIDAAGHVGFSFSGSSAGSTIKGLAIDNSSSAAITIASNNVSVIGNFIGVDPNGTSVASNQTGISIAAGATGAVIGTTALADRNLISGNTSAAIVSNGIATIQNNLIGTDATGILARANGIGLNLVGPSNIVGSLATNGANTIAYNTAAGVRVDTGVGNMIIGNAIYANGTGILLVNSGNANQASTTTLAVSSEGSLTTVQGTFNPTATGTYRIDFYSSLLGDPAASGQAHLFLGEISQAVASVGVASFLRTFNVGVPSGQVVTATVTSPTGSTSAFLTQSSALTDPYVVTTTADSGIGSLRSAIDNANQLNDTNTITFAIPTSDPGYNAGSGIWTITPNSALPAITQPVLIDGTTGLGYIGRPLIQLDGVSAGATADGLVLSGSSSNSRIRGLAIYAFGGAGIHVISGSDTIQSDFLGLDSAQTAGISGNATGLWIDDASSNTIGGLAGSGNLISNNTLDGIRISGNSATANTVIGNNVGTDFSGLVGRGNGRDGIRITRTSLGASNDVIGGSSTSLGNTIGFNSGAGITIDNATGNKIRENPVFQNSQGISLLNNANTGSTAPVITTVSTSAGTTLVSGTITGASSNTVFSLDFFSSGPNDPVSGVQARVFLGTGTVTTDASGNGIFSTTLASAVSVGLNITATATSATSNSTSPFALGKGLNNSFFQVTTTNDTGPGSLRQAILNANAVSGGSTIVFALSTSDPNYNSSSGSWIFKLASALPNVDAKTTIDGTSQPGYAGRPLIVVDGTNAGAMASGFVLDANASGSAIKGILVQKFSVDGIQIQSNNNTIFADSITANAGAGVDVKSGSGNTISQSTISGNSLNGISLAAGANGSQAAPSNLQFTSAPGQTQIQGAISGQTAGFYTVEFFVGTPGGSATDVEAETYIGSTVVNVAAGNLSPNLTAFTATLNLASAISSSQRIFATVTSPISAPSGLASNTSAFAESAAISSPYVVTTNADSGIGSLRQAILNADAQGAGATITFAITSGSTIIHPLTPLPAITVPLTINGNTQAGVAINGNQLLGSGLTLAAGSTGSLIEGLLIENFAGAGVSIVSDNNQLMNDQFNSSIYGVFINGGSGNVVNGGLPLNSSKFSFSNNTGTAIFVQSGSGNQFIGNNFSHNGATETPAIQFAINQPSPAAPVLLSLTSVGGNSQVTFTLNGPLNQPVTVDFYTNTSNGSVLQRIQSVVETPTSPSQLFSVTLTGNVSAVIATATSAGSGNAFGTSVFSNSATLTTNFVVTNLNDSGFGSLRQAILDSTGTPNAQIVFNINSEATLQSNTYTIPLLSPLTVDHPLTINGFSEYDYLNSQGGITGPRRQLIVIDGSNIPNSVGATSGEMVVTTTGASKSIIEGLIFLSTPITRETGLSGRLDSAIQITGTSAQITSDLIGVTYEEATYTQPFVAGRSGFNYGVHVIDSVGGNTIGDVSDSTVTPTVVGNTSIAGIFLDSSKGETIQNVHVGIGINPLTVAGDQRPLGNSGTGIEILSGGGNLVGGTASLSLVVVSGNGNDGIVMSGGTSMNVVEHTLVGTDPTATIAIPNRGNGIHLSGAIDNTIGGMGTNTTDVISGNALNGILIDGKSTGNLVENAFIGTDLSGTKVIPNLENGIHITDSLPSAGAPATSGNLIGGTSEATRVLVSGNTLDGILLDGGSTSTRIRDAYIGIDPTGQTAIANMGDGIRVNQSSSNSIGDSAPSFDPTASLRTVISGNHKNGIEIIGALSTGNKIGDTIIGTAVITLDSQAQLGNRLDGILIDGAQGTLVGLTWGPGNDTTIPSNVISGNGQNGIHLINAASSTLISYNFIGTDLSGLTSNSKFANQGDGVLIESGSSSNVVGIDRAPVLPSATFFNLVSGNQGNGITIRGTGTSFNQVGGNRIGISRDGLQSIGNSNGIVVDNASSNNIGVDTRGGAPGSLAESNTIQGNLGYGVIIQGLGSYSNSVGGNWIGVESLTSQHLGNSGGGLEIKDAGNNLIGGGAILSNHIVANLNDGILITYDAQSQSGLIGRNRIDGNVISRNVGNGVRVVYAAASSSVYAADTILNNKIGSDDSGNTAVFSGVPLGNRLNGILVEGARVAIDHNLIVANGISGVNVAKLAPNAFGNQGFDYPVYITGNNIGINFAGNSCFGSDSGSLQNTTYSLGNVLDGIRLDDSGGVSIGYDSSMKASPNVISGNLGRGIEVSSPNLSGIGQAGFFSNAIGNNFIGTNATGDSTSDRSHILGNLGDGIFLFNPMSTYIWNNVISGNRGAGIHEQNSSSKQANLVTIERNMIGTNRAGDSVAGANSTPVVTDFLGNAADGIFLDSVLGSTTLTNNLVSGNRSNGIDLLQSQGIVVQGNFVGTAARGTVPANSADFGNASNGIFLNESSRNWIGGTFAEGNTVSGNDANGIFVSGSAASPATGNTISGNRIGLDSTGYIALGNKFTGISLSGAGAIENVIGFTSSVNPQDRLALGKSYAGNVVSANALVGVLVSSDANGNVIEGNLIGTDKDGNERNTVRNSSGGVVRLALGNTSDGIFLNGVSNTLIGGPAAEQRNIIGGNRANGIHIFEKTSTNNQVINNFIGLNANGRIAAANQANGIVIDNAGPGNFIGGGNRISGNGQSGVLLYSTTGSGGTTLSDNSIGLAGNGLSAVANGAAGVFVFGSSNNLIGTSSLGGGNFISGNNQAGVEIFSPAPSAPANHNEVRGNRIGISTAGSFSVPNRSNGVEIYNGSYNVIGGLGSHERNTISGNLQNGIFVNVFPTRVDVLGRNVIDGNFIGTDVTGMFSVGSQQNGILIDNSPPNWIGLVPPRATTVVGTNVPVVPRNVISGNLVAGIQFSGNSPQNVVQGNYIGVRVDGVGGANLRNGFGVYVNNDGSFDSLDKIGGDSPGAGNIIAGGATPNISDVNKSAYAGIFLSGPQDPAFQGGSMILGNLIGLDANGNIAGSQVGILVNNSSNNVIGGSGPYSRNVISGNVYVGVEFLNGLSSNNSLIGNLIGTNFDGSNVPASLSPERDHLGSLQQTGVMFSNAFNNTVGANGAENTISGNLIGVLIDGTNTVGTRQGNTITNNKIGTNPAGNLAVPNAETGVYINASSGNVIRFNLISANGISGVNIFGEQSSRNTVDGNVIGPAVGPSGQLENAFVFPTSAPAPSPTRIPGYEVYLGAQRNGISIIGSSNNVIGGTFGNVISSNLDVGLYITSRDFNGKLYAPPVNTKIVGDKINQNGIYGLLFYDAPNNSSGQGTEVSGNPVNVLNYVTSVNGQGSGLTPRSIFLPPLTQTSPRKVPAGPRHRRRR